MSYLLDTHTFIWFLNGDKALSAKSRKAIEANEDATFISIASLWEIAKKISLHKLELNCPFSEIGNQITKNNFQVLPITFEDTILISSLPFHHRNPFDRIIITQSFTNKLTIISKDREFEMYGVEVIW